MDLSLLSQMLNKDTLVSKAVVNQVEYKENGSSITTVVTLIPEQRQVQAVVTFPFNSKNGVLNYQIKQNDLILVLYSKDTQEYFIIAYIPNQEDPFYNDIKNGSLCLDSLKIELGKNTNEAFVLGNVLKTYLAQIYSTLDYILSLLLAGNFNVANSPGQPNLPNPDFVSQITDRKNQNTSDKNTFLDDAATNILSQQTFGRRNQT